MKIENKCFHLRQNIKEAADILKDVVREDGEKRKAGTYDRIRHFFDVDCHSGLGTHKVRHFCT